MSKSLYQYYSQTIQPNKIAEYFVDGRFFTLLDWDGSDDPLISLGDQTEQVFPSGLGVSLSQADGTVFIKNIRIRNTNASAVTVAFAISAWELKDSRFKLSGSVFTDILNQMRGQSNAGSYGLINVNNATATQILAVNTNRKSLMIQNIPGNSGVMYIGKDNQVSNTKFMAAILPGQFYSRSDYQGEIWAAAGIDQEQLAYSDD